MDNKIKIVIITFFISSLFYPMVLAEKHNGLSYSEDISFVCSIGLNNISCVPEYSGSYIINVSIVSYDFDREIVNVIIVINNSYSFYYNLSILNLSKLPDSYSVSSEILNRMNVIEVNDTLIVLPPIFLTGDLNVASIGTCNPVKIKITENKIIINSSRVSATYNKSSGILEEAELSNYYYVVYYKVGDVYYPGKSYEINATISLIAPKPSTGADSSSSSRNLSAFSLWYVIVVSTIIVFASLLYYGSRKER